jgi:hypothetical protein
MSNKLKAKKCQLCNKGLPTIGNMRMNGKDHNDWDGRQYHKKCWKEKKEMELNVFIMMGGKLF